MKTRKPNGPCCLLAALIISTSGALGAESPDPDPKPRLPDPDARAADLTKPIKVFILMGQSNMFGMGDVSPGSKMGTLEYLTTTEKQYPHLVDDAGKWTVRSDVRYVQVMEGKGKMEVKFNGWLTLQGKAIGPELQFGHILGSLLDEPVLVLKSCIGNRSLGWDLLPPGSERFTVDGTTYAGYKDTPDRWVEGQPKKEVAWYAGMQYDNDVKNAKAILSEIRKYYPGAGSYEVAGFLWWQGHKDQNAVHASRYQQNLANLIKALRKDFHAPNAKFVIATGCGNPGRTGFGLQIAEAQLAVDGAAGNYPEFKGNVKTIDSRDFWREADVSPNPRQGYHYHRHAGIYMEVGNAMGWAMAELLKAKNGSAR